MSVFILGGKAKGFEVYLPSKVSFRPTSVMLRRKFFDSKQHWDGLHFIDLCAGSGAMGWEALSRGASQITLNDSSKQQQKILQHSLDTWCEQFPEDRTKVSIDNLDVLTFLESREIQSGTWLFFDPPYQQENLYQKVLQLLLTKIIPRNAAIIIEFELKKNAKLIWHEELEKFRSNKASRELQSSDRKIFIIEQK